MPLFHGMLIGLGFTFLLGPTFFALLQSTLENGFKSGFLVALGIFLSDTFVVFLLYGLGLTALLTQPEHETYLSIGGMILLLGMGFWYLIKPHQSTPNPKSISASNPLQFVAKGMLLNLISPFVIIFWVGVITLAVSSYSVEPHQRNFLIGTLLAIILTDSLKALFAHKLKAILRPEWMPWIYRGIGAVLVLFGMRILVLLVG
ncbi:MAG: LysE family transporter [Bacteroidota bacterium]